MANNNSRREWRQVFDQITERYQELKHSIGTPSCEGFYRVLQMSGNKGVRNPNIVLPNTIDFVADVELACKAALDPISYEYAKKAFLEGIKQQTFMGFVPGGFQYTVNGIKERAGRMFISRRIYPEEFYFAVPTLLESKVCSCKDKAHTTVETSVAWCAGGCGLNTLYHSVGYYDKHYAFNFNVAYCEACKNKQEEDLTNANRDNQPILSNAR